MLPITVFPFMKLLEYHSNLSTWMREYIQDVVTGIDDEQVWKRYPFINSPGWTLVHLIVEGELALAKLDSSYKSTVDRPQDFISGSDGTARIDLSLTDMVVKFEEVYDRLDEEVCARLGDLGETPISDEELKVVLKKDLDYFLHMLTTHLAMHCDALLKWRFASGMKGPYDE